MYLLLLNISIRKFPHDVYQNTVAPSQFEVATAIFMPKSCHHFSKYIFHETANSLPVYQRKPYDAFPFGLSVSDFFEEWGLDVKDITRALDIKVDIVVGNDVWIGFEAVILSEGGFQTR